LGIASKISETDLWLGRQLGGAEKNYNKNKNDFEWGWALVPYGLKFMMLARFIAIS
jgi:hypothetical protein